MANEIFLDFCIWGFEDISPEEITKMVNIQPVRIYKKGEKQNPKFNTVAKENGWRMNAGLNKYTSFDIQMNALLDMVESRYEVFKTLSEKYYCEFSCAIYMRYDEYESAPALHLNSRYNKIIKEMNIEFDLDLYYLPNKT